MSRVREPWNINIHHDAVLDRAIPTDAQSVLDVGCGDGFLASRLARRIPNVTALDVDQAVLARARERFPHTPAIWHQGDVLNPARPLGPFDAVVSNGTLHHLGDTAKALLRLSDFVRPGGVVAVVGFVRPEWRELPWEVCSFLARGVATRVRQTWDHCPPALATPGHLSAAKGPRQSSSAWGADLPPHPWPISPPMAQVGLTTLTTPLPASFVSCSVCGEQNGLERTW